MASSFRHFLTVEALTPENISQLLAEAAAFKSGATVELTQPVYAMNLFFEPSTRTHTSFEMAERKLGLNVLSFDPKTSSVTKGETLYDTLRTIESIGVQLAVIRHRDDAYYEPLAKADKLGLSIANAGDGSGQHPSQCLLDLMTIKEQFGHFDGLKIAICGDLRHSRVAHSDAMLLKRLGAQLYFCGPSEWEDESLASEGKFAKLDTILPEVDVMMLLRVQHERHTSSDEARFSAADYHQQFGLTVKRATQLKPKAIIMHPAPVNRGVELADELVEASQSRIFQQMNNGVYVRMAIIASLLRHRGLLNEMRD